jgi:hypothetical protein
MPDLLPFMEKTSNQIFVFRVLILIPYVRQRKTGHPICSVITLSFYQLALTFSSLLDL